MLGIGGCPYSLSGFLAVKDMLQAPGFCLQMEKAEGAAGGLRGWFMVKMPTCTLHSNDMHILTFFCSLAADDKVKVLPSRGKTQKEQQVVPGTGFW